MPERTNSAPAAAGRIKIVLIDDHPIVRRGLAQLIDQETDLRVSAEASSAADGLKSIEKELPDVVLVDLSLPDSSGMELVKTIHDRWPAVPVLVLSMHDEALHAERALRAGAKGYVMKEEATETVLTAIRRVARGEIHLSDRMSSRVLNKMVGTKKQAGGSPLERLSDREMQIFQMIGQGDAPRDIAQKLKLSVKTVEAHRERIKEKLGLKSGPELMRHAMAYLMNPRLG